VNLLGLLDENSKKKMSCKCSSINQLAAGLRLPNSSRGFFLLLFYFSNILCEINLNVLDLHIASAFTRYFKHNNHNNFQYWIIN